MKFCGGKQLAVEVLEDKWFGRTPSNISLPRLLVLARSKEASLRGCLE